MPETNASSGINPSDHQPALFFIQVGIEISGCVCTGVRVSKLPDPLSPLNISISKSTYPNVAESGTMCSGPVPRTNNANFCSPGSPVINQYR